MIIGFFSVLVILHHRYAMIIGAWYFSNVGRHRGASRVRDRSVHSVDRVRQVKALAWHPFHEEYFVSGSYDGSIFHWLVGHETPQVEIPGAHESSVLDLAWHPIGYLLCSGSNDHTTKFWCRNRPGDTNRDRYSVGYNQGYGEQNPLHSGRMMGGFPVPEPPPTPGPFAPGLSRIEGTIPGIGVAMPLQSLDCSDQGERQAIPGIMPPGAPPLPPGPHPSLLAPGQQQAYQQFPPQQQQPQQQQPSFPQQMVQHPLHPPNLNQMQQPSHLPLLQHPHLPRPPPGPPPQVQQLGMPAPMPSSMPGSMPMASTIAPMPLQNPMAMQGSANQMISPMPQGHMMGLNQMHSGPSPAGNIPPDMGGFPNGLTNIQGAGGAQNFPMGSMFNRPQVAQMSQIPGLNTFQPGMMDGRGPGMGLGGGNMGLPPPPPPQGSAPQ